MILLDRWADVGRGVLDSKGSEVNPRTHAGSLKLTIEHNVTGRAVNGKITGV
jgi:hypothetical protein